MANTLTASLRPLSIKPFRNLAAAMLVNVVGDVVGLIALSVLVFDESGSALALTLLFVAKEFLPALVAPGLASRLEALPAGLALATIYLANAAVYAVLALVSQHYGLSLVLGLALVDGVLTLTGRSLSRGTTATVLRSHGQLREGNALINNFFTLAHGLGPLLGGLAIAAIGVTGALLVDGASFVFAGVLLATARGLPSAARGARRWWPYLRDGVAYLGKQPVLRLLFATDAVTIVFLTAVLPIEVVLVKETFGKGNAELGLFLTVWGIGMAVGGLLFTFERRAPLGAAIVAGNAAMGAAYAGIGLAPAFAIAAAINLVGGIGNGVQVPSVLTAIQHRTPDAYQVRVAAVLESVQSAMPGVGYLLGGAVAVLFSARGTFLVAGCGVLAIVAIAGARVRRAVDEPGEDGAMDAAALAASSTGSVAPTQTATEPADPSG